MMHLCALSQISAMLLTVGAAEWQVAVNTTLTDVNAFLDHIVSSTNMRRVPSVSRFSSLSQGCCKDCAWRLPYSLRMRQNAALSSKPCQLANADHSCEGSGLSLSWLEFAVKTASVGYLAACLLSALANRRPFKANAPSSGRHLCSVISIGTCGRDLWSDADVARCPWPGSHITRPETVKL